MNCNEQLTQQNSVDSFDMYKQKILNESLRSSFTAVMNEDCFWFHYITIHEQQTKSPKSLASILVTGILEIKRYVNSSKIPFSCNKHLMSSNFLKTTSELTNILVSCKSLCDDSNVTNSNIFFNQLAVSILEQCIAKEEIA